MSDKTPQNCQKPSNSYTIKLYKLNLYFIQTSEEQVQKMNRIKIHVIHFFVLNIVLKIKNLRKNLVQNFFDSKTIHDSRRF